MRRELIFHARIAEPNNQFHRRSPVTNVGRPASQFLVILSEENNPRSQSKDLAFPRLPRE